MMTDTGHIAFEVPTGCPCLALRLRRKVRSERFVRVSQFWTQGDKISVLKRDARAKGLQAGDGQRVW